MRKFCRFVTVLLMLSFWGVIASLGRQLEQSGPIKQLEAGVSLVDLQVQSSWVDFLQSDTGQVNSVQALLAFIVIATVWRGVGFLIRIPLYFIASAVILAFGSVCIFASVQYWSAYLHRGGAELVIPVSLSITCLSVWSMTCRNAAKALRSIFSYFELMPEDIDASND
ncbi:hypothetical protein KBD34_03220 [Patescibacteria group bacterium]|nr:hypothetical protein [Patescibacteria group bacterium]